MHLSHTHHLSDPIPYYFHIRSLCAGLFAVPWTSELFSFAIPWIPKDLQSFLFHRSFLKYPPSY